MTRKKIVLHVGCGSKNIINTPFKELDWEEIRLDIDNNNKPDIVNSMTDMHNVLDSSVDAVFSSHNIEHLYEYQVEIALKEFIRVLKPEGFALITCPDLMSTCKLIVEDKLNDIAYMSKAGGITPLDILYGHRLSIKAGNEFMCHKTGFTKKTLTAYFMNAGFETIATLSRSSNFDLWGLATKAKTDKEVLLTIANNYFPS